MAIVNVSKKYNLATRVVVANSFFKRLKGLLGCKSLNEGEALIITHSKSIHTFFMRFPIDVLFVDKNNKIVKLIPSLKPFRLTSICFKSAYVVELPSGKIHSSNTSLGDLIGDGSP
jgi:hypothetical protein